MIKSVIYSVVEHCPHCHKDITIRLRSDDPDFLIKATGLKPEVSKQGMHLHWFHNHRVCARCGKLIHQGQGWWALASKVDWQINKTYRAWTHKRSLNVLDVHRVCIDDGQETETF